jgi:hypothetical protein
LAETHFHINLPSSNLSFSLSHTHTHFLFLSLSMILLHSFIFSLYFFFSLSLSLTLYTHSLIYFFLSLSLSLTLYTLSVSLWSIIERPVQICIKEDLILVNFDGGKGKCFWQKHEEMFLRNFNPIRLWRCSELSQLNWVRKIWAEMHFLTPNVIWRLCIKCKRRMVIWDNLFPSLYIYSPFASFIGVNFTNILSGQL